MPSWVAADGKVLFSVRDSRSRRVMMSLLVADHDLAQSESLYEK